MSVTGLTQVFQKGGITAKNIPAWDSTGTLVDSGVVPGTLTPGTTIITGGIDKAVLFDNAGLLGENANLTYFNDELVSLAFVSGYAPNGGYFSINDTVNNYLGALTTPNAWFGSGSNTDIAIVAENKIQFYPGNLSTSALDIGTDGGVQVHKYINLVDTTSSTVGVLNLNSLPFLHAYPGVASFNCFVGNSGNFTNTGVDNAAIGYNAMHSLTTGNANMAIGRNALFAIQGGFQNVAVGTGAFVANVSGGYNVVIGTAAGANCTSSQNVLIGDNSGPNITSGSYNTLIGVSQNGQGIVTGSNNVIIGCITGFAAGTSNTIILGDNLTGTKYLDYNYTTSSPATWTFAAPINVKTSAGSGVVANFANTAGTAVVEIYSDGSSGFLGIHNNLPLAFYTNNSASTLTLGTDGSAVFQTSTANRCASFTAGHVGGNAVFVIYSNNVGGQLGTDNNFPVQFYTNNNPHYGLNITTSTFPSVVIGDGTALALGATDGFLYIPTCAGTPIGVPTAQGNTVPMIYDKTNNKFYIYNGGWKGGTNPGTFT